MRLQAQTADIAPLSREPVERDEAEIIIRSLHNFCSAHEFPVVLLGKVHAQIQQPVQNRPCKSYKMSPRFQLD